MARSVEITHVLAEARYVRGLAWALLRNEADAGDAMQGTWLAALEHPPRDPARLRGWLRRVVGNAAARLARRDRARRRREAEVARPELLPSSAELVERSARLRQVTEMVEALDEPYRTAILLRYFEGVDSAEIARRQSVPPGTVRARISRGLDRLRDALRERHGPSWPAIVSPLAGNFVLTGAGAGILLGVLTMSAKQAVAAAVILVLAGAGWWWWAGSGGNPGGSPRPPETGPQIQAGKAGQEPPAAGAALSAVPFAATEDPAGGPPAAARIRGRVIDEHGDPIAGATVFWAPAETREPVDLDMERPAEDPWSAQTGADGRFDAVLPPPPTSRLLLAGRAPGFSPEVLAPVFPGVEATLNLKRTGTLAGRVIDAGGIPLPGARVKWSALVSGFVFACNAVSGSDGHYRLDGVALDATSGTVEARLGGFALLTVTDLGRTVHRGPMESGGARELDLVMIRGLTATGVVLDGENRRPIPGARVSFRSFLDPGWRRERQRLVVGAGPPGEPAATTDDEGRFQIGNLPADGFFETGSNVAGGLVGRLLSRPAGYGDGGFDVPSRPDGAAIEVEILCWPAAKIRGRVVDSAERPLEGAMVWALVRAAEGRQPGPIRTDARGIFEVEAVPAALSGALRAEVFANPPGHDYLQYGGGSHVRVEVSVRPGETTEVPDLVLDPLPSVVITTRDSAERPIPGARVRSEGTRNGVGADGGGRIRMYFSARMPPPLSVVVEAPGCAPNVVEGIVPSVTDPPTIDVRLGPGGRLFGRVTWSDGAPASGVAVTILDGRVPIEVALPSGIEAARRTDAWRVYRHTYAYDSKPGDQDGTFEFRDLPEGPYHLVAGLRADAEPIHRVVKTGVPPGEVELVLGVTRAEGQPAGAIVEGRVSEETRGRPILRFHADLSRDGRRISPAVPTLGVFRFDGIPAGRWSLLVKAPGFLDDRRDLEVPGPGASLEVAVALRRGHAIEGHLRAPAGIDLAPLSLRFHDSDRGTTIDAVPGQGGAYRAEGVPPGRYQVTLIWPNMGPWTKAFVAARPEPVTVQDDAPLVRYDVTVAAGGWLEIELRCVHLSAARSTRLEIRDRDGIVVHEWRGAGDVRWHCMPLPAGTCTARLEIDGALAGEKTFEITEGRQHSETLEAR